MLSAIVLITTTLVISALLIAGVDPHEVAVVGATGFTLLFVVGFMLEPDADGDTAGSALLAAVAVYAVWRKDQKKYPRKRAGEHERIGT